ncbi:PREDICTED: vacuolar fusion protein CCZ1 homolog [Erythranthe guttata]|uniref:vacuolar fusion protein CCZ1 homolog n=1 Tax=Erythranthe guttata TaxID=4155 RepID=UPI00064DA689|nr:PREDICTED: vacuolar fusion protein CCZ1 homolog [Erythranthe guttata]|eukprot:XP_012845166.1 PREDICTED: vacuolar fusion protein CCZ1 homolog [Erythranthe guttata]
MGLTSGNDGSDAMKLCVFDLRRGQTEGQELDKILFFNPADLPLPTQLSVIGLSEGLITFTRIFSPDAPCEVIEAEMHSHVFYEAEPDIWMVMVRYLFLRKLYPFFLFNYEACTVLANDWLDQEIIFCHFHTLHFLFGSDFSMGKKFQLPNFRDSLRERGTLQMLTVGREAAIEVQCLVRALESCAGNTQCFSLTMFQDLLVSTNLSPIDTVNLFTYAILRLTPLALSAGARSWSSSSKGNTACNTSAGAVLANYGSVGDQYHNSHDTSPLRNHNHPLARPLQHSKWSKGKDGFLVTDIWGVEVNSLVPKSPTIWLHQTEEKMYLLAYQHRGLTVIILIPVSSVNGEQGVATVKQQILEHASLKMFKVEEKLARGWGGENAYHVSGYRYLLVDGDRCTSRASPPGKVTTLTKESLVALSKLREEIDKEKSKAKWDNEGGEKDLELCIRAKNNAWLIARLTRGKELYMVLEKANETLLYASDAVEKFSDRYCNGSFSLD